MWLGPLRGLMWKNCRLKQKNKVSLLFELIYPACIALFLVYMNYETASDTYSNCYYQAKALPSAGGLSLLQSTLCAFKETCDNKGEYSSERFNSSLVVRLSKALKNYFESEVNKTNLKYEKKHRNHKNIFTTKKNWTLYELVNSSTEVNRLEDPVVTDNILRIKDNFSEINRPTKIEKKELHISGLPESFYPVQLTEIVLGEDINILSSFLCGEDAPPITEQFDDYINFEYQNQAKENDTEKMSFTASHTFEPDEDATEFCNLFMEELHKMRPIWKFFLFYKPLLRGKVIYTPDTPATKRVMKNLSDTFSGLKKLIDALKNVFKPSEKLTTRAFRNFIRKFHNNEDFFKKLLKTTVKQTILKDFENKTFDAFTLKKLKRAFNKEGNILEGVEENWEKFFREYIDKIPFLHLVPYLECLDLEVIPAPDEESGLKEAVKWLQKSRLWGYIIFMDVPPNAEKLPSKITYKIRTGIERSPKTYFYIPMRNNSKMKSIPLIHLTEIMGGYVFLQNSVESGLISELTGRKDVPGIYLKQTPLPCYMSDDFSINIRAGVLHLLPVFLIYSWMCLFCRTVKKIAAEKESLLREILVVYGVTPTHYRIAWFLDSFFIALLSSGVSSFILVMGFLSCTNFFFMWFFQLLFCIPTILFAMFISTFFFKTSFSTILSGVIYVLMISPHFFIQHLTNPPGPILQFLVCLISNVSFGYGGQWIVNEEIKRLGPSSEILERLPKVPSIWYIALMLLLDALIYLLLAIYSENVIAVRSADKKPWYYCVTGSYWRSCCGRARVDDSKDPYIDPRTSEKKLQNYEEEPRGLKVGVEVKNLTKVFGKKDNKRVAVNNLSMNFYEGQITSFLGSNGAGKSTSILMMTGVLPVTKGSVRIYGVDITKEPELALKDIGICRQENIFIGDFSTEDHLKLIGKIKGLKKQKLQESVQYLIALLQMGKRAKYPVKWLSGGWKRKVCVAMAFMGGSRTIFLDEPTAGIDPFARRSIWDLLIKLKSGRTIILITHHLDEADALGDRIAIIAEGKLLCSGSSAYLKSQVGRGYTLSIDSNHRPQKMGKKTKEQVQNVEDITKLVISVIPNAEFIEELGSEIKIGLPQLSGTELNGLFDTLEKNKQKLNFSAYGISAVSLNEVFLKFLKEAEEEENERLENLRLSLSNFFDFFNTPTENGLTLLMLSLFFLLDSRRCRTGKMGEEKIEGNADNAEGIRKGDNSRGDSQSPFRRTVFDLSETIRRYLFKQSKTKIKKESRRSSQETESEAKKLFAARQAEKIKTGRNCAHHFVALIIKRYHHYKRNVLITILQIILPLIFMLFCLLLILIIDRQEAKDVETDISNYTSGVIFYTNDLPENKHAAEYEAELLGPYGLGLKCILSPEKCSLKSIVTDSLVEFNETIDSNSCDCNEKQFKCKGNATAELPHVTMTTGDVLFNMTGRDLNNWLIATQGKYLGKRLGGISFGHFSPITGISFLDLVNLFPIDKVVEVLSEYLTNDTKVNTKDFLSRIMSVSNKTYGLEMFKNVDPSNNLIVWFNHQAEIASVTMLNAVSNLILRAILPPEEDPSNYSIHFVDHPLSPPEQQKQNDEEMKFLTQQLNITVFFLFSLSVMAGLMVIYIVEEKMSGMRHLLNITGINRVIYWLSNFVWDYTVYSFCIILIILLFLGFQLPTYTGSNLPAFIALLFSIGFAHVAFAYLISIFFNSASAAFIMIFLWINVVGLVTFVTNIFINQTAQDNKPHLINKIFMVFPEYCFCQTLMLFPQFMHYLGDVTGGQKKTILDWDFALQYIVAILLVGCGYLLILLLLDFRFFQPIRAVSALFEKIKTYTNSEYKKELDEDLDVKMERERVESGRAKEDYDMLVVNKISKIYCRQKAPAVNRVSVGVKHGECFGLLGTNGAGKSTVFNIITGFILPSEGDVTIGGYSIKNSPVNSRILIGYCPQMSALDPYLTPAEHLSFFGRVRGLTGREKRIEVNNMLERLQLMAHKDKKSKSLSGGTQRKLNAAIALLCKPEVVLLDEPTTGMDLLARQFLWSRLLEVVQDGRCLVLTSHSMEECQALSTQISIMHKGRFTCFGSGQQLKTKFSEGYSIAVRLFDPDMASYVITFFDSKVPGLSLEKIHHLQLLFKLDSDTNIGKAVTAGSEAKDKKLIEDYSINQTTLESVFLNLAGGFDQDHDEIHKRRRCGDSICCC